MNWIETVQDAVQLRPIDDPSTFIGLTTLNALKRTSATHGRCSRKLLYRLVKLF